MEKIKINNCARVSITLPKKIHNEFKKYCDNNSLKLSTKIAELINKFMKKQK